MVITGSSGTVALNRRGRAPRRASSGLASPTSLRYDHLLFLLCLVIPLRGWRQILSVITVFTVAHSFTLLGSAFNLAPSGRWFPPSVETAIAASIVYMALENIMGVNLERRVLITGLFGLVHGFGFSYGLQQNFQFAGTHLLVSLFAFNVGIEFGQVWFLRSCFRRSRWCGGTCCLAGSDDHSLGDRRRHRLALDDRPRGMLWKTPWPQPSVAALRFLRSGSRASFLRRARSASSSSAYGSDRRRGTVAATGVAD